MVSTTKNTSTDTNGTNTANPTLGTLVDSKPVHFAAGVFDKIREEAPGAIAAVRATDPKELQARLSKQAKVTQAKVNETLTGIDGDIKKLRAQAQQLATEYAAKARETYDELADRGRVVIRNQRAAEDTTGAPEITVERTQGPAPAAATDTAQDAAQDAAQDKKSES
jgi:uncharacterized protein YdbL (DUF1318 family)